VIVDTSTLVAIATDEPESKRFTDIITASAFPRISAATLLEAGIVIDGKWPDYLASLLDDITEPSEMIVEPFTLRHAQRARRAYMIYGKGKGHPARLNFGDCISYALAKELDEPLLFKGDDFIHTDVRIAVREYP
jgi:ribonuclease VapC